MLRTANPALNEKSFHDTVGVGSNEVMTINGTVNKTLLLTLIIFITAGYTWKTFLSTGDIASISGLMLIGGIGGFITALITVFKKTSAPITAPLYAALEGLFIGGISAQFEAMYPGIVIQAIALTIGTLFCLLLAYKSGAIKATENFKLGIVAATGAVFLIYLITWILSFFNIYIPFIHEGGTFGIIFSAVVVTIAALNLVLDFDFIENASANRSPKYMEWYGAFGLMVTLVWLYIEILRLLAKLRDR